MNFGHDEEFQLASNGEVPPESVEGVLEQLSAIRQDKIARQAKMARQSDRIAQKHRDRLRAALGSDSYEKYRSAVLSDKRSRRRNLELPSHVKIEASKHGVHGEEALSALGIDPEVIRSERRLARDQFEGLLPNPPEQDGQWVELLTSDQVPDEVKDGTIRGLQYFSPPYNDSAWGHQAWPNGAFTTSQTAGADKVTGFVRTFSLVENYDADDSDSASAQAAGLVGFWYKMPTSGLLEVWIQAQCSFARHHVTLLDEWGVSDASVRQDNQIAFRAQGGGIATQMRTSVASWFHVQRDTSGTWTREYLTPGQKFWAHLFSDVAFPAGTWVHVEVGTQNWNVAFTNDMQVTSRTDFRYFIPQAAVGSTGG